MQLIIGGKHMHYSGLNGQFCNIYYGIGKGVFIGSLKVLLKHILGKIAPKPLFLKSMAINTAITDANLFNVNDPQEKVVETTDSERLAEEYAVAGWFRWISDILVEDPTPFIVFNLRQNQQRSDGVAGALGDRDLEIQFLFGGYSEGAVYFNTYTALGNNGHGNPLVTESLETPNHVWTYFYFAYSTYDSEAYGVLIQPALQHELTLLDIIHSLPAKLYLHVGSDAKQTGFNGFIGHTSLFVGPGSFRKGLKFGYSFNFDLGAMEFFRLKAPN